jgi:hypothetical protein
MSYGILRVNFNEDFIPNFLLMTSGLEDNRYDYLILEKCKAV